MLHRDGFSRSRRPCLRAPPADLRLPHAHAHPSPARSGCSSSSATADASASISTYCRPSETSLHGARDLDVVDRVLEPVAVPRSPTSSSTSKRKSWPRARSSSCTPCRAEDAQIANLDGDHAIATARRSARRRRLDVVDAQDRRAALERGDRGRDARAEQVVGSRRAARSELLREKPTSTGLPSASRTSSRRTSSRFCCHRLAEADARVEADPLLGDPRRDRERQPLLEKGRDLRRDSSYRGSSCIVRGSPCMCMRQRYAPASATTPASSGSPRRAVTSLTRIAPRSSAARATSAFDVSIESGSSPPSRSRTGTTRRSSSSAETPSEPGRVDSPPMSTIAAPSAIIRRPPPLRPLGRDEGRRPRTSPASR